MIFQRVFADFSASFQYFLKQVSALKFPLNATKYYANHSVLSVESIMLMTIIETKRKKTQILLNYLRYRDSYQIIIYKD